MSRDAVFYRSHVVWASLLLTGSFVAYGLSPWGVKAWRATPSLRWLHSLLPWPVMAAGFVLYVALLATRTLTAVIIADCLGLFMYGCELVALTVTLRTDRASNVFAIAAMVLACVLHYAALRLAIFQKEAA